MLAGMTRARSIAVAQTTPMRGDVDGNVGQHVRLVNVAAEERAQVLVFPELSLTGDELKLANDLAFSQRDPRLNPCRPPPALPFLIECCLVITDSLPGYVVESQASSRLWMMS